MSEEAIHYSRQRMHLAACGIFRTEATPVMILISAFLTSTDFTILYGEKAIRPWFRRGRVHERYLQPPGLREYDDYHLNWQVVEIKNEKKQVMLQGIRCRNQVEYGAFHAGES